MHVKAPSKGNPSVKEGRVQQFINLKKEDTGSLQVSMPSMILHESTDINLLIAWVRFNMSLLMMIFVVPKGITTCNCIL